MKLAYLSPSCISCHCPMARPRPKTIQEDGPLTIWNVGRAICSPSDHGNPPLWLHSLGQYLPNYRQRQAEPVGTHTMGQLGLGARGFLADRSVSCCAHPAFCAYVYMDILHACAVCWFGILPAIWAERRTTRHASECIWVWEEATRRTSDTSKKGNR